MPGLCHVLETQPCTKQARIPAFLGQMFKLCERGCRWQSLPWRKMRDKMVIKRGTLKKGSLSEECDP